MTDVKLTDFTADQLQVLLNLIVVELSVMPGGYIEKFEALQLWRTQILNAISTVQMREQTQAN